MFKRFIQKKVERGKDTLREQHMPTVMSIRL